MKLYLLFTLFALTTQLSAQQKDKNTHRTNLSIFVLHYDAALTQLHWLDKEGSLNKKTSISTSTSSILTPIKYKGPKVITLCSVKKNAAPDDIQFTPVAKVNLPVSKNTILILIPNSKAKTGTPSKFPYRAIAIDDSDTRFIAGSRWVFNFTQAPIRGITGEVPFEPTRKNNNRFILKTGKSTIVKSLSGKTFNQIYLEQKNPATKQWERFKSSRWFSTPNKRKFVFIYQKGNTTPRLKIASQTMGIQPLTEEGKNPPNIE